MIGYEMFKFIHSLLFDLQPAEYIEIGDYENIRRDLQKFYDFFYQLSDLNIHFTAPYQDAFLSGKLLAVEHWADFIWYYMHHAIDSHFVWWY